MAICRQVVYKASLLQYLLSEQALKKGGLGGVALEETISSTPAWQS